MFKLITCIAAEDRAQEAVQRLDAEFNIQALASHFGRGLGRSSTTPSIKGLGQQTEKTIFSILVPRKQADEIFNFIYEAAGLHRAHGGIIYVTSVKKSVVSPHIDEQSMELAKAESEQEEQPLAE